MKMRGIGEAGVADIANNLTAFHSFPFLHNKFRQVGVPGFKSKAMVYIDYLSV